MSISILASCQPFECLKALSKVEGQSAISDQKFITKRGKLVKHEELVGQFSETFWTQIPQIPRILISHRARRVRRVNKMNEQILDRSKAPHIL